MRYCVSDNVCDPYLVIHLFWRQFLGHPILESQLGSRRQTGGGGRGWLLAGSAGGLKNSNWLAS